MHTLKQTHLHIPLRSAAYIYLQNFICLHVSAYCYIHTYVRIYTHILYTCIGATCELLIPRIGKFAVPLKACYKRIRICVHNWTGYVCVFIRFWLWLYGLLLLVWVIWCVCNCNENLWQQVLYATHFKCHLKF